MILRTPMAFPFAIIASLSIFGCSHKEQNDLAHAHGEAVTESNRHDNHTDNEIIIEPSIAKQYGIKTERLETSPFSPSIRVTGEIIQSPSDVTVISASTPGILTLSPNLLLGTKLASGQSIGRIKAKSASGDDPNAISRAQISVAEAEVARLKPLLDDGIVTLREYNVALAALKTAKASYSNSAASGAVNSPASGTVIEILANSGQFVDTGTPIAKISRNEHLILRADVPERYHKESSQTISVKTGKSDEWITLSNMGATRISDSSMPVKAGFIPVLYSFRNDGRFSAGMTVEVDLGYSAENASPSLSIPLSAVIEQQGNNYVYVRKSDHGYEKRRVVLGGRSEDRVEIRSGLTSGDEVVIEGATVVKMAENSGTVPEGHSHNH